MAVHTAENWLGEEEEPSKEEPSKEDPRGEKSPVEAGGEQYNAAMSREGELHGTGGSGEVPGPGGVGELSDTELLPKQRRDPNCLECHVR